MDLDDTVDFAVIDEELEKIRQIRSLNQDSDKPAVSVPAETHYDWDIVPIEPTTYRPNYGTNTMQSSWNGWSKDTTRDDELNSLANELSIDDIESITRQKSDHWYSSVTDRMHPAYDDDEYSDPTWHDEDADGNSITKPSLVYESYRRSSPITSPIMDPEPVSLTEVNDNIDDLSSDIHALKLEIRKLRDTVLEQGDIISGRLASYEEAIRTLTRQVYAQEKLADKYFNHINSMLLVLGGWTPPPQGWTAPPHFALFATTVANADTSRNATAVANADVSRNATAVANADVSGNDIKNVAPPA
jgi:hypothetical protein